MLAPSLIRLVDPSNTACRSQPFRATRHANQHVSFSDAGKNTLRIKPNGAVDNNGGNGPWARFIAEEGADENGRSVLRFKSVGHLKQRDCALFLNLQSNGELSSSSTPSSFHVVPAEEEELSHQACERPTRLLTDKERSDFVRDGFLIIRNAVAPEIVDDALRDINHNIGIPGAWIEGEDGQRQLADFKKSQHFRDLLYASQAYDVAQQLLGPAPKKMGGADLGGQLALRFPEAPDRATARKAKSPEQWHIDGMKKSDHMSPFQLLMGVALSDQLEDDVGNLHVWQGMHEETHAAVARQYALRTAASPLAAPEADTGDAAADVWLGQRPSLPSDRALQVHLRKGDIVLAHQKTPHAIGLNRSPNIRYQVYFRLAAANYQPEEAPLGGLWDGWRVGGERGEGANEEEEDVEMVAALAQA